MAFDPNNFIIIGGASPYRPNDVFIHERENVDGKPGKIVTMGDARGDVKEIAKDYIDKGFDPSKIIINGQPATDVFEKQDNKIESKSSQPTVVQVAPWAGAIKYQPKN